MLDMHKSILIVEDDKDFRESLQEALNMLGFTATSAANGQEALEKLRSKPLPCLILLDLMMPVMNGWQFRTHQRADPNLAAIPVVVVTADGNAQHKAAGIDAAGCIKKPVDLDALVKLASQFCTV